MSQNTQGRHIWPGNFTSRTDPSEGNWSPSEVVNQIKVTRSHDAGGNVHFSMKAFTKNYNGVADALKGGVYALKALVPASPWLDGKPPLPPRVAADRTGDLISLSLESGGDKDVRFFAVMVHAGGKWMQPVVTSDEKVTIRGLAGADAVAVYAIDRVGNESKPAVVQLGG
jgi:hypothetical protein